MERLANAVVQRVSWKDAPPELRECCEDRDQINEILFEVELDRVPPVLEGAIDYAASICKVAQSLSSLSSNYGGWLEWEAVHLEQRISDSCSKLISDSARFPEPDFDALIDDFELLGHFAIQAKLLILSAKLFDALAKDQTGHLAATSLREFMETAQGLDTAGAAHVAAFLGAALLSIGEDREQEALLRAFGIEPTLENRVALFRVLSRKRRERPRRRAERWREIFIREPSDLFRYLHSSARRAAGDQRRPQRGIRRREVFPRDLEALVAVCGSDREAMEEIQACAAANYDQASNRELFEAQLAAVGLAPRELEVTLAFSRGERLAEIARRLRLAPSTIRNTWSRARRKLASNASLRDQLSATL